MGRTKEAIRLFTSCVVLFLHPVLFSHAFCACSKCYSAKSEAFYDMMLLSAMKLIFLEHKGMMI